LRQSLATVGAIRRHGQTAGAGQSAAGAGSPCPAEAYDLAIGHLHVAIGLLCRGQAARYCVAVIALLFAAVAVGLSNLAASIGIGVTGVNARTRLRVGVIFGAFEAGMPIVGLVIGQRFAADLGQAARWPGAILLMVVGASGLVRSLRGGRTNATDAAPRGDAPVPSATLAGEDPARDSEALTPAASPAPQLGRLLFSGLALSLDNLVVGFALGTYRVGVVAGAILIGAVSVAMSLAGLELGRVLSRWVGQRSEQMSGVILILVGAAIAGGALT
jgi:manganese efflux pump family protein